MPHDPHPGELSSLLASLVAFFAEHQGGALDGGADDEDGAVDGLRVWGVYQAHAGGRQRVITAPSAFAVHAPASR